MRNLVAIVLSFALASCITPPKLDPQQQTITSDSIGLPSQVSAPPSVQAWWTSFNDPQLDRLMEQALAANPTLAQAMARVREAQSLSDLTRAGLPTDGRGARVWICPGISISGVAKLPYSGRRALEQPRPLWISPARGWH